MKRRHLNPQGHNQKKKSRYKCCSDVQWLSPIELSKWILLYQSIYSAEGGYNVWRKDGKSFKETVKKNIYQNKNFCAVVCKWDVICVYLRQRFCVFHYLCSKELMSLFCFGCQVCLYLRFTANVFTNSRHGQNYFSRGLDPMDRSNK